MKKVIFEGVVNDVKFDNVEAYNKAIAEAVASGKEFNAYTNTKMAVELTIDYTKRAEVLFPGVCASDELTENMFHDIDSIRDIYLAEDNDIRTMVDENVCEELKNMSRGEREMYYEDLGKIYKFISDYRDETSTKIEATDILIDNVAARYERQVQKLEADKKALESALRAADKLAVYYTESMKALGKVGDELKDEPEEEPETTEREQAISKLLSLCESIFPDYKKHFDTNK